MKRIIYFMTPAYGHSFVVMPIIKKLVENGIDITCYTTEEFKPYIEKCGARFIEYSVDFSKISFGDITADLLTLMGALIDINEGLYLSYHKYISENKPDLLMYDSMCSFAKSIAKKFDIPSVCTVSTLAYNLPVALTTNIGWSFIPLVLKNLKEYKKITTRQKSFRKEHNLPNQSLVDLFMNSGDETLVFAPKELQPLANTFPKSVHFVGTTIKDQIEFFHDENIVYEDYDYYISRGTVFGDMIEQFCDFFLDEELQNYSTIACVGNQRFHGERIKNRDNLRLESWVLQLDLMPHIGTFINQGGMGSVFASIYFGKPQVCIPIQEEQRLLSIMAKRKGVGIYLKRYDLSKLKDALKKKPNIKKIAKLQQVVRSLDGTKNSVEIINKLLVD